MANKKDGFTLIEIIVSLAIIGTLSISFLPLFTMALSTIFSSGRKSNAQFNNQIQIEQVIANNSISNTDNLSVSLPGFTDEVILQGKVQEIETDYVGQNGNTKNTTITIFIPEQ